MDCVEETMQYADRFFRAKKNLIQSSKQANKQTTYEYVTQYNVIRRR